MPLLEANPAPVILFAAAAPKAEGPKTSNLTTTNSIPKDIFVSTTNNVIEPSSRSTLTNRFIYLNARQKELALNFDQYATNKNQNLSLIVGTAQEHDNAFETGLGVWFNDPQHPTLYELAQDKDSFRARHTQFIEKYGSNRVSTLQWSFHGLGTGEGFTFTSTNSTKDIFHYQDEQLKTELAKTLGRLLKKNGATVILDSCGDRDINPAFIDSMQALLKDLVSKSELQNIRFYASRIPFSSPEKTVELSRGEVTSLRMSRAGSLVDISIKKTPGGSTELIDNNPIDLANYQKTLNGFRQERAKLEKSFDDYTARLDTTAASASKVTPTVSLLILQNDFANNANELSTHCNLFADTIAKLDLDYSKTPEPELRNLIKDLTADIMSIRKLLAHKAQLALVRDYNLSGMADGLAAIIKHNAAKINLEANPDLQVILLEACPELIMSDGFFSPDSINKAVQNISKNAQLYSAEEPTIIELLIKPSAKEELVNAFKDTMTKAKTEQLNYYQAIKAGKGYQIMSKGLEGKGPQQFMQFIELKLKDSTK